MMIIVNNTFGEETPMYFPYLKKMLHKRHISYKIVKSIRELEKVPRNKIQGIILSGSPLMNTYAYFEKHPDIFFFNMYVLLTMGQTIPIFGICFGCQFINLVFGGTLRKLPKPYCQDTWIHVLKKSDYIGRACHTYVLDKVSPSFRVLAKTGLSLKKKGGRIPCMIQHKKWPIYATSFHPEYHKETHFIFDDFLEKCFGKK